MFILIIVLALVILWLMARTEAKRDVFRKSSQTAIVLVRTRSPTDIKPDESHPRPQHILAPNYEISINACEQDMLGHAIRREFMKTGSYVAEPKRSIFHFGTLDDPDKVVADYRVPDLDNLEINVIPDDKTSFDLNNKTCILYFTRQFIERFGDLGLPLKPWIGTMSIPILASNTQCLDGDLYYREHDDTKYIQLLLYRDSTITLGLDAAGQINPVYKDINSTSIMRVEKS